MEQTKGPSPPFDGGTVPIKIFRAETGEVYEVDVVPFSTIGSIKERLAKLSNVHPSDQILLNDKLKLEDDKSFAHYGLPVDDRPIFLFNRRSLQPNAPSPPATVLDTVELKLLPEVPCPQEQGLVGLLLKYQHQFRYDLNYAKAVLAATDDRLALCRRCYAEQEIMAKALEAAIANLNDHNRQILQAFDTFKGHLSGQQAKHQSLLESFDSDLAKLREVALHPALRTSSQLALIDCIPEDRLRQWAAACKREHEQLNVRVMEVASQVSRIQNSVEAENKKQPDVAFDALKQRINGAVQLRHEAGIIRDSLAKDCKSVVPVLEEAKRQDGKGDKKLWAMCEGFEQMKAAHTSQLHRLIQIDETLQSTMQIIGQAKTQLSLCVHNRLQNVSSLQSAIRDTANKIVVFREALSGQKQAFSQLMYIRYLPDAYHAALREVVRRKAFALSFSQALQEGTRNLQAVRQQEMAKRERFLLKYGRYIPKSLITGLTEELPDFSQAIKVIPFDRTLPAIECEQSSLLPPPTFLTSLSGSIGGESERIAALEAENARLQAELAGKQQAADSPAKERGTWEQAYQRRIQDLEEKLAATYQQPSPRKGHEESFARLVESNEQYKQETIQLQERLAKAVEENRLLVQNLRSAHSSLLDDDITSPAIVERDRALADSTRLLNEKEEELAMLRHRISQVEGKLEEVHQHLARVAEERDRNAVQLARVQKRAQEQYRARKEVIAEFHEQRKAIPVGSSGSLSLPSTPQSYTTRRSITLDGEEPNYPYEKDNEQEDTRKEVERLKALVQQNAKQLAELDQALESKDGQLKELGIAGAEKEAELQQLRELPQRLAKAEEESAALRERLRASEEVTAKQCQELEQEANRLREELAATGKQLVSLRDDLEKMGSTLRERDEEVRLLKQQLDGRSAASIEMLLNSAHQEKQLYTTQEELKKALADNQRLTEELQRMRASLIEISASEQVHRLTCDDLEQTVKELNDDIAIQKWNEINRRYPHPYIAIAHFKVDELILFLPNSAGHYEAFNQEEPYYYLSEDSLATFAAEISRKQPIVGQIVFITEHVVTKKSNPYNLDARVKNWHEVTITRVHL